MGEDVLRSQLDETILGETRKSSIFVEFSDKNDVLSGLEDQLLPINLVSSDKASKTSRDSRVLFSILLLETLFKVNLFEILCNGIKHIFTLVH